MFLLHVYNLCALFYVEVLNMWLQTVLYSMSKRACWLFLLSVRPHIKTIFQAIAAKVGSEPCCDWVRIFFKIKFLEVLCSNEWCNRLWHLLHASNMMSYLVNDLIHHESLCSLMVRESHMSVENQNFFLEFHLTLSAPRVISFQILLVISIVDQTYRWWEWRAQSPRISCSFIFWYISCHTIKLQ